MYASAYTQNSNEILSAIPMFSGSDYRMRIVAMLYDQTGRNLKWKVQDAVIELEVVISKLVDKIVTRFQHLNLRFWGTAIQRNY